jgi:hypothetical protein
MRRQLTLEIRGDLNQALASLRRRGIAMVRSTVESRGFTKVVLDGEAYNPTVTQWLNERRESASVPGALLRARWV